MAGRAIILLLIVGCLGFVMATEMNLFRDGPAQTGTTGMGASTGTEGAPGGSGESAVEALGIGNSIRLGESARGMKTARSDGGAVFQGPKGTVRVSAPDGYRLDDRVMVVSETTAAMAFFAAGSDTDPLITVFVDTGERVEPRGFTARGATYEQLSKEIAAGRTLGSIELKLQKIEHDASGVFICGVAKGETLWIGYRLSGRLFLIAIVPRPCSAGSNEVRTRMTTVSTAFIGNR